MPWRNQASTNYTNRAFYSGKDATEDYFILRKPKVPGRGGKTCRRRTGNHEFLQRRRKGLQAYRFLHTGKEENFFFSKKLIGSPFVPIDITGLENVNWRTLTYHHRKCHPEKMMADQELNSRDGRYALTYPDNFIIPYPSPCGLLLQHRADKGQY